MHSTKLKLTIIGLMVALATMALTPQSKAQTGTDHGFFWSLYFNGGSASISFPEAGTYAGNFAMNWNNCNDVIGGKGWNPGSRSQVVGYNIGSLNGTYNSVSVYGWTTGPLVEYYICEKGSVVNGTFKGSVSSDGHSYNTYEHQQVNQPSIEGTATFEQYLDNWGGTSVGANNTVTCANHFNHWASLGMNLGTFNYQILAAEYFSRGSGSINATVW